MLSSSLKKNSEFIAAAVLLAMIAVGLWFGNQEMDRIERITGERPTLYDVLAPW